MTILRDWIKNARTVVVDPEIETYVDPLYETYRFIQVILAAEPVRGEDESASFTEIEIDNSDGTLGSRANMTFWVFHRYTKETLYIVGIIDATERTVAA